MDENSSKRYQTSISCEFYLSYSGFGKKEIKCLASTNAQNIVKIMRRQPNAKNAGSEINSFAFVLFAYFNIPSAALVNIIGV